MDQVPEIADDDGGGLWRRDVGHLVHAAFSGRFVAVSQIDAVARRRKSIELDQLESMVDWEHLAGKRGRHHDPVDSVGQSAFRRRCGQCDQ